MEIVLVLIALALVGAGVAVFMRGRAKPVAAGGGQRSPAGLSAGTPAQPLRSDVRSLRVGDVVNYDSGDFVVEGTLRLEQGGFRWSEHRLVDGTRVLWLSVEEGDDGLECAIWDRGRGIELEPGPRTLTHDGVTYELDERGKANYTSEGATGTGPGGRVEYADYAADDDVHLLAFERFGDDTSWEVGLGRVISEHALDIYPGRDAP